MKAIIDGAARVYFVLAVAFLTLLAIVLLGWGGVGDRHRAPPRRGRRVLDSAGLVIIGFAIIETARVIAEEELARRRELRSAVEARRSLTKFITIIVIAVSLEALVMVFEAGRTELSEAIYPAVLFSAAMLALVALGVFQWLSSCIAAPPGADAVDAEDEMDHRAPEGPDD